MTDNMIWSQIDFYTYACSALTDYEEQHDDKSFALVADLLFHASQDRCACFVCEGTDDIISGGVFIIHHQERPVGGLVCLKCVLDADIDKKFREAIKKRFFDDDSFQMKTISVEEGHA